MEILNNLKFFFTLIAISIRASISSRGAFLFESFVIFFNNLIMFLLWWIFFLEFNDIRGWHIREMAILTGVASASWGLMQIFFGRSRHISRAIINGELDTLLTQPKNVLIHLLCSKSLGKGWGDVMALFFFLWVAAPLTIFEVLLVLVACLSGCLVFTSIALITQALTFWLGSIENLAKKYIESIVIFTLYPLNIYSGFLKIVLFTALPAGVIGFLPVELISHFSWEKLILLLGASLFFPLLGILTFYMGLRRYESGNLVGNMP